MLLERNQKRSYFLKWSFNYHLTKKRTMFVNEEKLICSRIEPINADNKDKT